MKTKNGDREDLAMPSTIGVGNPVVINSTSSTQP